MDSFDDVIREAIQQLPAAFESQSAVPPHYEPERLDEYFRRDDNITLLPRAEAQREDEVTAELDARDEIIADLSGQTARRDSRPLLFTFRFITALRTESGESFIMMTPFARSRSRSDGIYQSRMTRRVIGWR